MQSMPRLLPLHSEQLFNSSLTTKILTCQDEPKGGASWNLPWVIFKKGTEKDEYGDQGTSVRFR